MRCNGPRKTNHLKGAHPGRLMTAGFQSRLDEQQVSRHHWKMTTFTAGLRLAGMTAPLILDGPMDGECFLSYVEQILVPTLRPRDVVVMDNLPAHRVKGVRSPIERAGPQLLSPPPYSPDFNPIEQAFS